MININTPVRIIQACLAITALGLNGYVTSWYQAHTFGSQAPASVLFALSVGALTLAALPYLFLNPALSITHHGKNSGRFFNKYVVLALDAALMILWFAGFVDLAVFRSRLLLCGGHVCQVMAGGSAIGALSWFSFLTTMILAVLHIVRTRSGDETKVQMTNHSNWVGSKNDATA